MSASPTEHTAATSGWLTLARQDYRVILGCAILTLLLAMGIRASFGLFMQPMGVDRGFGRDVFSLAFAIQNLVWGLTAPLLGALADRHGSGRAIALGAVCYLVGVWLTASAMTPMQLYLTMGVLIGIGQAGTTFGVVLAVVGRAVPPQRRSVAFGMASAGGSLGQFLLVPLGQQLISRLQWHDAMLVIACLMLLVLAVSALLVGKPAAVAPGQAEMSLKQALREALGHHSYHLLFWSFFVCGFHTAFITLHLPSFVADQGLSLAEGASAVALIGLFNVIGSYSCGWLGGKHSKKIVLAWVYGLRAVFILLLLMLPLSPMVLYLFAAGMGLMWLGTVPLTNGLVGQIYGLRYVSTLYGLIFVGHQIGSFIGVWSGGQVYTITGSYDAVWWVGVALALAAAALCWPIDERALQRSAPAGQGSA